jgi:hypothetical protein
MKTPPETGRRKSLIFQEWIKITGLIGSFAPFGQNLPVQTDLQPKKAKECADLDLSDSAVSFIII